MTGIGETKEKKKRDVGFLKRMTASVCKHCPLCKHARKSPESVIGRILHHPFHSENCPVWKSYQEVYGEE